MSEAGASPHVPDQSPLAESFDDRFSRELAELNASLAKIEASIDPGIVVDAVPVRRPRRRAKASAETAETPAASAPPPPPDAAPAGEPTTPAPPPEPPPAAPPVPPLPTGTDLSDPKNFGLLPPTQDLERGTLTEDEYRQRLGRHLAFANQVLHTSRVPAAVWREWRVFEKAAQENLRSLAARPPEPVEPAS